MFNESIQLSQVASVPYTNLNTKIVNSDHLPEARHAS